MKLNTRRRKNGFDKPLHSYQIFSWVIFALEIFIFIIFYLPTLRKEYRIWSSLIVGLFTFLTFYYAFMATRCDPTDYVFYEEMDAKQKNIPFTTELKHFCSVCGTHVQPRSKHCGACNRCVSVFDHHCYWLNNCIGSSNYRLFIKLILSLFILECSKIILAIHNLNLYYNNTNEFEENVKSLIQIELESNIFGVFLIISLIMNSLICLLITQLIILHCWLYFKKMTTYELIISRREKQVKKAKKIIKIQDLEGASPTNDGNRLIKGKAIYRLDNENHYTDAHKKKENSELVTAEIHPYAQVLNYPNNSENDETGFMEDKKAPITPSIQDRKDLNAEDQDIKTSLKKSLMQANINLNSNLFFGTKRVVSIVPQNKIDLENSGSFYDEDSEKSPSSSLKITPEISIDYKHQMIKHNATNQKDEFTLRPSLDITDVSITCEEKNTSDYLNNIRANNNAVNDYEILNDSKQPKKSNRFKDMQRSCGISQNQLDLEKNNEEQICHKILSEEKIIDDSFPKIKEGYLNM